MNIRTLQMLVAVVESGSMSDAARRLGTSRSNISRRLKAEEQALKVQLFRRTTRRVEPTQIGWALYEHAARIGRELGALHATVEDLGRNLRGRIRISMPVALGHMTLGPLLFEFASQYPDVDLQVTFSNQIADLLAEDIDIAIRVASRPPEAYVVRDLGRVSWAICANPAYLQRNGTPQTPEQLTNARFVSPPVSPHGLTLELGHAGEQTRVRITPHLQSTDMLFLKQAALNAVGLVALPYYSVAHDLGEGKLAQVMANYSVRVEDWGDRLYLITAQNLYPTLAIRTLIDFLLTHPQLTSTLSLPQATMPTPEPTG